MNLAMIFICNRLTADRLLIDWMWAHSRLGVTQLVNIMALQFAKASHRWHERSSCTIKSTLNQSTLLVQHDIILDFNCGGMGEITDSLIKSIVIL